MGENAADLGMIDQGSRLPLHYQISGQLRHRIESGGLPEGTLLPGEAELQSHYKVSRTTVRQALAGLVTAGLISRHPGKGTIVARRITDMRPRRLVGFIEQLRAMGMDVRLDVTNIAAVEAPPKVAMHLGLPPGSRVTHIRNRTLVEDVPIGMSSTFLPCQHQLNPEDIVRRGAVLAFLRAHVEDVHRQRFTHATRVTGASMATLEEAEALGVQQGSPVVLVTLSVFCGASPAVYIRALYRADRYEYKEVLEI